MFVLVHGTMAKGYDRLTRGRGKGEGMTVFARTDHAAGAAAVGLSLRPTEVLIFGKAKKASRR